MYSTAIDQNRVKSFVRDLMETFCSKFDHQIRSVFNVPSSSKHTRQVEFRFNTVTYYPRAIQIHTNMTFSQCGYENNSITADFLYTDDQYKDEDESKFWDFLSSQLMLKWYEHLQLTDALISYEERVNRHVAKELGTEEKPTYRHSRMSNLPDWQSYNYPQF